MKAPVQSGIWAVSRRIPWRFHAPSADDARVPQGNLNSQEQTLTIRSHITITYWNTVVLDVVAKVEDERVECSVIRVRRLEVVLALDDRDFEARRQIDVLQQQTSKRPQ